MRKLMFRIFVLLVLGVFFYSCGYNTMQKNEEEVFNAWGNVESSLQRRADLIPNLVEVVKGYAAHERETLEAVINARAKAARMGRNAGSNCCPSMRRDYSIWMAFPTSSCSITFMK